MFEMCGSLIFCKKTYCTRKSLHHLNSQNCVTLSSKDIAILMIYIHFNHKTEKALKNASHKQMTDKYSVE